MNAEHQAYEEVVRNACRTSDTIDLVRLISEGNFKVNQSINSTKPLFIAVEENSLPIATFLLENGADPNAEDGSAFTTAIISGQPEMMSLLLDKGADPNIPAADALSIAIRTERLDLVQLLLDRGADISLNDFEVMRSAILESQIDIFKLLLNRADRVMSEGSCVMTEKSRRLHLIIRLFKAVIRSDAAKVKNLLENNHFIGPKVFLESLIYRISDREISKVFVSAGMAVKHIYLTALAADDVELQEFCLECYDFDPKALKFVNQSLFAACRFNRLRIIKLLVDKYGLDLNVRNSAGETPLFHIHDHNVLRNLLSSYSELDVNTSTAAGKTLIQYQYDCKSYAVLLEHGANPWFRNKNNLHFKISPNEEIQCNENPGCAMVQHVLKLSLIDSDYARSLLRLIMDMDVEEIEEFDDLHWPNFKSECEDELLKMRSIRISQSTSKVKGRTLFDFMLLEANEATRYAKNIELLRIYEEHDQNFKNYLPHYGFALNYQFRRCRARYDLFETALEILGTYVSKGLPADFAELIFGFFSNHALSNYISRLRENDPADK